MIEDGEVRPEGICESGLDVPMAEMESLNSGVRGNAA